jgi:aminoglycoside phosphotransferase (APT) family kinase protein
MSSDPGASSHTAARQAFDPAPLARYLRGRLPGFEEPMQVTQFEGGQSNPTYRLRTPSRSYVLRRKPPGPLLPSAHAVDREFRVMQALRDSEVPVPRMMLYCEDPEVVGTAFFVMEFLEGRVFWDPTLPGIDPAQRAALYDEMNRVLACIHRVDVPAVGLGDYGKQGRYVQRQIERWTRQYRASETDTIDEMERLIEWLPSHAPDGDETGLVHGDYRIDNLVFDRAAPRVLGVLDWELSTLGHPLVDFAYHAMLWRVPGHTFRGLADADLGALGIPSEDAYLRLYCERTGRARIDHWDFYIAFNLFRIAAILQGIMSRALEGNAASAHALQEGQRVRPLASIGWAQARRIGS